MTRLNGFIRNQGQFLLENKRHAMLYAVALALLPYTAWLSVAVVALVTLRRGWCDGGWLLILGITAYFASSLASTTASSAFVNALLTFMPCYLAACVLGFTASWRAVVGVFFLQVVVAVLLLQTFVPEFITAQYLYFQATLREIQSEGALLALINDKTSLNQIVLANYLLGVQAVAIVFSASVSLILARSGQSQLFYPGGFRREMLTFRGDRIGLLLLAIMFIAAHQQNVFAMCLLPILMFYFVLAGLSLSFNVLAKQRPLSALILLVSTLLLLPFIMLPVYIIFGSLDSIFNLRLYLPSDAGKTI